MSLRTVILGDHHDRSPGEPARFVASRPLLSPTDASTRHINNSVLDRLDPFFEEPIATLRSNVDHWAPGDLWFHYIDERDVRRWLDLLGGWLPTVLAQLAEERTIVRLFPDRTSQPF